MDTPNQPGSAPQVPPQPTAPLQQVPAITPPQTSFNVAAPAASTPSPVPFSVAPSAPQSTPSFPPSNNRKLVAGLVIGVLLVSGALGYFVFPEPFYNFIGKYIGLSAPQSEEENLQFDVEAETDEVTENTFDTSAEETTLSESNESEEQSDAVSTESEITESETDPERAAEMQRIFEEREQELDSQTTVEAQSSIPDGLENTVDEADQQQEVAPAANPDSSDSGNSGGTRRIPRPRE